MSIELNRFKNKKMIPGNGNSPYTGYMVFTAWDNILKKEVAVKVGKNPKTVHSTIYDEYNNLKILNHYGIIKVFEYGKEEDVGFMIMEKHEIGGRRSRWREVFKDMKVIEVQNWIRDLIDTLFYLQRISVLHEDVEMANIVGKSNIEPVLIDFGRVRYLEYSKKELLEWLSPSNNTRINAWVRELCGIGGTYAKEGKMVDFNIDNLIRWELRRNRK